MNVLPIVGPLVVESEEMVGLERAATGCCERYRVIIEERIRLGMIVNITMARRTRVFKSHGLRIENPCTLRLRLAKFTDKPSFVPTIFMLYRPNHRLYSIITISLLGVLSNISMYIRQHLSTG